MTDAEAAASVFRIPLSESASAAVLNGRGCRIGQRERSRPFGTVADADSGSARCCETDAAGPGSPASDV